MMESSVSFPQQAGELLIPPRSETPPSRSAASSRAAHRTHTTDFDRPGVVSDIDTGDAARASSAASQRRPQHLQIVTDLQRGAPGDPNMSMVARRTPEQAMRAKQTHQFYGEVFSYREPAATVKDRVGQDSIVTAEVKTNVIIKDEYSFLTSLSSFLSQRYNRPESSILITLAHSTCLLLAGSFDPAYLITITALPNLVGPTTNKRNAALTQAYMAEELCVPADRGVIRFTAVEEASLATNGTTVLADIQSKTKSNTSRNFPPVPESPRSTHTEHSTARSFFSKKASKRSLKEQKASAVATLDRSKSPQQERQELVPQTVGQGRRTKGMKVQGDPEQGDDEDAMSDVAGPLRSEGSRSRASFSQRLQHSRKTSADADLSDSRRSNSTAPTSADEEQARIAAAKTRLPKEVPRNTMDNQAEKAKSVGKRKSFRTIFGKL